jgi:hypothetical protein
MGTIEKNHVASRPLKPISIRLRRTKFEPHRGYFSFQLSAFCFSSSASAQQQGAKAQAKQGEGKSICYSY